MGFCSLISGGLESVRGGSSSPPVLSTVRLVSMRGTRTLQDLWHHASGVLVGLAGRPAAVVKSQVCGENTFLCWHRHSRWLLRCPHSLPALLTGLVRLHSRVRPPCSGLLPLGGVAGRLHVKSSGTTCWLPKCVFRNAVCAECLGEPGCGAAGITGRRLLSQMHPASALVWDGTISFGHPSAMVFSLEHDRVLSLSCCVAPLFDCIKSSCLS